MHRSPFAVVTHSLRQDRNRSWLTQFVGGMVVGAPCRRQFLHRLMAVGLGSMFLTAPASARNPKKRGKKPKRNAFGCVNVGGKCRGRDSVCCSGICQGNKPKKGQKDRSRCVAHDASTCQAGHVLKTCGGVNELCVSSAGLPGVCATTTGNAGYCAVGIKCIPCAKDADCQPFCGPAAACIACVGCKDEGGADTACISPEVCW